MNIAVLLDKNGKTTSFYEPGIIKVYSSSNGGFKVRAEIIFSLDETMSINTVRENIKSMANSLKECKVFVGRKINGLPYTMLDLMGFSTWEIEGTPMEFLEHVIEKESEQLVAIKESKTNPFPIEKDKTGYYYLDLKSIQKENSGITSKQALLPFLNNEKFFELEIICGHIPPWFDVEFKKLNLNVIIENKKENEFTVIVFPKNCSNN